MSSKLFRAVVGLGISFGTASVACLGAVDLGSEKEAPGPITPPTTTTAPPGTPPPAKPDVPPPASSEDAGVDAPQDVGVDAFCDATWPTTKGTPVPTCGPIAACADAGPRPYCYALGDAGACILGDGRLQPVWCVSSKWQCGAGFSPAEDCRCFEGEPCN